MRSGRLTGILAGLAAGLAGCAAAPPAQTPEPDRPVRASPLVVERISITAAGHFVDLRYRVTDAAAAQAVLTPKATYRLIDERTGQAMLVPTTAKLGSLRQSRGLKTDHSYFMLFMNAGLQPGSMVTVDIAGFRFPHLRVQ